MSAANSSNSVNTREKKKLEEKILKVLRDLASLPHNKQCCDCSQKGPTYVNVTIGSFVCTACSGILRGLNPPHRVKSINLATFTQDEVEFIRNHGNLYCKLVYMSLFDSTTGTQPDSRNAEKLREFLTQKYEKKRWYTPENDSIKNEIKLETDINLRTQQQSQNSTATANSHLINSQISRQQTLLIDNNKTAINGTNKNEQHRPINSSHNNNNNLQRKNSVHLDNTNFKTISNNIHNNQSHNSDDLFATFDPFASNSISNGQNAANNFANFDMFGSNSTNNHQNQVPNFFQPQSISPQAQQQHQNTQFMNQSANHTTTSSTNNQNKIMNNNSDRYSALAELDSIFQPTTTAAAPITPPIAPVNINTHNNTHLTGANFTVPPNQNPFSQTKQNSNQLFHSSSANTQPSNQLPLGSNLFSNHNTNAQQFQPFSYTQPNHQQQPPPTLSNQFMQQALTNQMSFNNNNNNLFTNMNTSSIKPLSTTNNPFISIAQEQSQLQKPKTNSSNPFL